MVNHVDNRQDGINRPFIHQRPLHARDDEVGLEALEAGVLEQQPFHCEAQEVAPVVGIERFEGKRDPDHEQENGNVQRINAFDAGNVKFAPVDVGRAADFQHVQVGAHQEKQGNGNGTQIDDGNAFCTPHAAFAP